MVLPLTFTSLILFLLWELSSNEVCVEEILLSLGRVKTEVFIMCHSLAEVRGDTVQDDIDMMMVSYLGINIKSINIVQVFLDSTHLLKITYLVKRPVRLIVVTMVFPNGGHDFSPSIEPMLVRLPPFLRISLRT